MDDAEQVTGTRSPDGHDAAVARIHGYLDEWEDWGVPRRATWPLRRMAMGAREGQYLTHLDGDVTNNDPANLRVVNPRENSNR